MKRSIALLCVAFGLTSCAGPSARVDANAAIAAGNEAFSGRQHERALSKYDEALRLAVEGGSKSSEAIALYGLARTSAHLCRTAEAERWFLRSIALRETLPDTERALLTQNYLEFARFLQARGRTAEAISYVKKSLPMLEQLGIEARDPVGYADLLSEYALWLNAIQATDDAARVTIKAKELRDRNPQAKPDFIPLKYPTTCAA
jgi:tetratricopeptide (TPR) repeat protein